MCAIVLPPPPLPNVHRILGHNRHVQCLSPWITFIWSSLRLSVMRSCPPSSWQSRVVDWKVPGLVAHTHSGLSDFQYTSQRAVHKQIRWDITAELFTLVVRWFSPTRRLWPPQTWYYNSYLLLGIFAPVMVTNTKLCPYQLISAVYHENLINVTRLVYTNVIASYLMKNCARVYRNISAE